MKPLRRLRSILGVRRSPSPIHSSPQDSPCTLVEVPPAQTDPNLTAWLDSHLIAIPHLPRPDPVLWLFLGGSYARPQRQSLLLQTIASCGDFAINLRYPNDWTIGRNARISNTPNAHEALRLQVLDGRSRLANAPAFAQREAIIPRFHALLRWLTRYRPEEPWTTFSSIREPRWQQIAVAGHSQGGGHAALLAREIPVRRVVMLAAPMDSDPKTDAPAPWLSVRGMTTPDRFFGFVHQDDPSHHRILRNWQILGLDAFGPPACIEQIPPPYAHSHQLLSQTPAHNGRAHGAVAVDRATPLTASGQPAYLPAWHYLFQNA